MTSRSSIVLGYCACLVGCMNAPAAEQQGTIAQLAQAGREDVSDGWLAAGSAYEVVPNWPQPLHTDLTWARVGSIFAESPNRVFVFQTGEVPPDVKNAKNPSQPTHPRQVMAMWDHCGTVGQTCAPRAGPLVERTSGKPIPGARWEHILMIFDENGTLVESWEQHNSLFTHPHGIVVDPNDPDRHVWAVDDGSEQIFKFTRDGKLVLTIGEFRVRGNDETHLGGPAGMIFLPNGDFFVADGYKNSRVVKFSRDGKYLMEFGKPGTGPGEFNTPHSVAVAADGRIFVSDRGNLRIQVFDKDGKYLSEIRDIYANALAISKDQRYLWVASGGANPRTRVLKYDLNGKLLYFWERPYGVAPDELWGVHDFSADNDGNLYFAESMGGRPLKYRPKPGADRASVVGPLMRTSFE